MSAGLGFVWLTLVSPETARGEPLPASEPVYENVPATAAFPEETSSDVLPSAPPTPSVRTKAGDATLSEAAMSSVGNAPVNQGAPYVATNAGNAPPSQAAPHVANASTQTYQEESPTEKSSRGGLLGPIRLGPMIGAGLPNLLNFGLLLKITDYFGAGVNVGLIPTLRVSYYGDATLNYDELDGFVRIHPFAGGFFIGSGLGYATISGSFTDTFDTSAYASQIPAGLAIPNQVTYSSQGSVRTLVITPQIGYFYTTEIGFSLGIDFGAQVPIAPSNVQFESQLPLPPNAPPQIVQAVQTQLLDPSDSEVRSTLESIGRTPIPTVNVRIGWLL